ncbi:glycoside hydrolase family 3 N-terminal domain-containing protein [uncultured Bacteroides sp.]|uniref:glycoside hydrolase family 3 N-terminal domain-containing protein n=1 Tax=uncultured Bacteroides sp. TaxID=162156 RepID=UPI002AABA681|nr:glycoside hydrolase family 3 N-terminal domain-containing protein [uncultured Bacteroides sp.]
MKRTFAVAIAVLFAIAMRAQVEPLLVYKVAQQKTCQDWVEKTLSGMSQKEKVGQLFIYTVAPEMTKANKKVIRKAVHVSKIGGLLFSGGHLENQAQLTNLAQSLADIPLMITFDGEWGLSMRLKYTPVFPKNVVLGCIQNDRLLYEYGQEVARQCKEMGVTVNFAPVADVNRNPNNPVINVRSFGEEPHAVADKVIAYAQGLESNGVLSVAKHFPGHGDTDVDSHLALPILPFTRERLDSVELYPFKQYIKAGLGGIMVGHLQVPIMEPNKLFPSSLSRNIVYGLLADELRFQGLIFTDALAMKGVASADRVCLHALLAGNDMVLAPQDVEIEVQSVLKALKNGEISQEDIDRKCRKVLLYKYALGLTKAPKVSLSGLEERINTANSEALIHKLRMAAITVLGNREQELPFRTSYDEIALVNVGGYSTDSVFVETVKKYAPVKYYQLTYEMNDSLMQAMKHELSLHKRVIVSITDKDLKPYLHFFSALSVSQPAVYVFFTPFTAMEQLQIPLSVASAVVLGHSADNDVQAQVGNVLFAKAAADGRLSASVGTLYSPGDGVTINPNTDFRNTPEDFGMNSTTLARIDSIVKDGIRAEAFPGCQVLVLKDGKAVYDKDFGNYTYDGDQKVKSTSMYDLASLSKTTGTLLAIMKLYDKGLLSLTDKASKYLAFLRGTDKEDITIKELLFHETGLPPSLPFYRLAIDETSYESPLFVAKKDSKHSIKADENTYASSSFKFKEGWTSATPSDEFTMHVAENLYVNKKFHEAAMNMIAQAPLKAKKYVYSCINFIVLKEIAETISGMSMDQFLNKEYYAPMKLYHMCYLPLRTHNKEDIVPTVKNDFLRGGTIQGFVHDEAAAFLGGVSGNAGLFASAHDVAKVYQMLLNGGELNGKRYLSKATCKLFTTTASASGRRGLGYDKPVPSNPNNSPCCVSAPAAVYGHTGFTGTCCWVDPVNGLVYVFLSNRTYPDRSDNKLSKMNIRTNIQELIYKSMK